MPSLQRYPVEFRRGAVELAKHSGKTLRELAKELSVSETTLGRWVVHEYTKGEPGAAPNEEVEQLRRECARLVQEREILKKLWRCMPGRRSYGKSVRNSRGIHAPWNDRRRCVQAAPCLQERVLRMA